MSPSFPLRAKPSSFVASAPLIPEDSDMAAGKGGGGGGLRGSSTASRGRDGLHSAPTASRGRGGRSGSVVAAPSPLRGVEFMEEAEASGQLEESRSAAAAGFTACRLRAEGAVSAAASWR
ncbi:hypothetical protein E2562_038446 [Oryza meyeriana var. granulata]|uniref:Uncharacterized protein n=1 Tax=Oryza meyeriana var. granulata TaxID=110450 RepID=A0A6G1E9F1_9ORYZ|nr:hypothetical protein E2562_038446 [Oryza meyeriana var. granulata]